MLNDFFANYGSMVFLGALILLVMSRIISSSRKSRKERSDPPFMFGPIRGMYVCYQCDTIFNTPKCPVCNEDATIPLIHLTGSVMQFERVSALISKLQENNSWKIPVSQDGQAITLALSTRPELVNNDELEVPVAIPVRNTRRAETVREFS